MKPNWSKLSAKAVTEGYSSSEIGSEPAVKSAAAVPSLSNTRNHVTVPVAAALVSDVMALAVAVPPDAAPKAVADKPRRDWFADLTFTRRGIVDAKTGRTIGAGEVP